MESIGNSSPFESAKKIKEDESEYWLARELQVILGYTQWRRFEEVIIKAQIACKASGYNVSDHFANVGKIVEAGVTTKKIPDYELTRYACYLIAQNGDPRKEQIAMAQTYFAVQTHKQEVFENLDEDDKRLLIRGQVSQNNQRLFFTAKNAGVKDYARFNDAGYKGLYKYTENEIHRRKNLKSVQKILDHMCSEELAANLFRITQTDAKIRNKNIQGEEKAVTTHYMVGRKVRAAIEEIGGTMPEDLPTVESIKEVAKKRKRLFRLRSKDNSNGLPM